MARFPIVDDPCPLAPDEIAAIDGECGRCGKTVHSLDGMGDAERSALLRQAKGAICVLYRLPVRIGAALALSLAAPAIGQETPQAPCDTQAAPAPAPDGGRRAEEEIVVTGGTVREPANARWLEDTSVPELPTAADDD